MADEARRIDDSITELKVLMARLDAKFDVISIQKEDHEKRIRAVEQLRTQVLTLATVVSIAGSAVVSYALSHLN